MAKSVMGTKNREGGEFVYDEYSEMFCRESSVINNAEVGATNVITDPVGQPVKLVGGVWQFATAANVTAGGVVNGFLVSDRKIDSVAAAGNTDFEYAILKRPPACINEGQIPATDVYGNAIDAADFKTEAEALGFAVRSLGPTREVQSS